MAAIGDGWATNAWIEASWITGAWSAVVAVVKRGGATIYILFHRHGRR